MLEVHENVLRRCFVASKQATQASNARVAPPSLQYKMHETIFNTHFKVQALITKHTPGNWPASRLFGMRSNG
eukprot:5033246-Heterocapsa_arctica.AAC.1